MISQPEKFFINRGALGGNLQPEFFGSSVENRHPFFFVQFLVHINNYIVIIPSCQKHAKPGAKRFSDPKTPVGVHGRQAQERQGIGLPSVRGTPEKGGLPVFEEGLHFIHQFIDVFELSID